MADITGGANEKGIGSGPYVFESNDQSRQVLLRNENWWGASIFGLPKPKRIVDIRTASNNIALGMVLKGELDLSNNFLPGIATLVMSIAVAQKLGKRALLLAQGFVPILAATAFFLLAVAMISPAPSMKPAMAAENVMPLRSPTFSASIAHGVTRVTNAAEPDTTEAARGGGSEKSMAGVTGLEPATSGLTGQRSNRLSYTPASGARAMRTANGILPASGVDVYSVSNARAGRRSGRICVEGGRDE